MTTTTEHDREGDLAAVQPPARCGGCGESYPKNLIVVGGEVECLECGHVGKEARP